MPGQWQLSFHQMLDLNGKPVAGALAYFYDASTADPVVVYAEYSLATPLPNPVTADGWGRFPGVWLDDATADFVRFRVTDADGVVIIDTAVIQIYSVSEGGGGGDPPEPVEATAVFQTGDIKPRYDTSQITGWRLCNGQTIGSATSGASYANDNAQALFEYLWGKDSALVVVGGRGVSAAADWGANKRLTLPDYRGYALVGMDTMGNTAAGRIAELVDLSARTGAATVALTEAQLPTFTPTFTGTPVADHEHDDIVLTGSNADNGDPGTLVLTASVSSNGLRTITGSTTGSAGGHTPAGTISSFGSDEAHANVQPSAGIYLYIKL